MIAVLGLLSGFAITAFGTAAFIPEIGMAPLHQVTESIQINGLVGQLEGLAIHELTLTRNDLTRSSDTADSLLRRLGVSDPGAASFLRANLDARRLIDGSANKMVQVSTAADGTLLELVARFPALDPTQESTHFTRLKIARINGQFAATTETAALVAQVRLGNGQVQTSLWAATDEARLPDAIASQLIDIFSGDIDFHRQLKKGDTFSVTFEAFTADDQPISWNNGTGRILSAEFVNNGKALQAVWYQEPGKSKGGYFGYDGSNRRKPFLASPLDFSRVTSGFAMRFHPIQHNWRAHNGVDYGAPTGTAVRAVSDGLVEFAGRQSGYGNVIQLQHDDRRTTVYAHLSQIDVRVGQHITQGQQIGAVGATGWATGPHLHFEMRVNGQFQDPLLVTEAVDIKRLDATARPRFMQLASVAKMQLVAAKSMSGFRGDAE